MLKYENRRIIDVGNWDALVVKTYGKPYSFQQQDGCKERGTFNFEVPSKWSCEDYENETLPFEINGSEMGIKFDIWLGTTEEDINNEHPETYKGRNKLWWDRNFYPHVDMIIKDLYERDLIEEGKYTIDIDW